MPSTPKPKPADKPEKAEKAGKAGQSAGRARASGAPQPGTRHVPADPPARAPSAPRPAPTPVAPAWQVIPRRYGRQIAGGLALALAFVLLLSLRGAEPSWIESVAGWTALPLIGALSMLGGVLLLWPRAGYWSVEALLGAEVLLLALAGGTYLVRHPTVSWQAQFDGRDGGVLGWALGSLAGATLGRGLGLFFFGLLGVAGVLLLVRYTPLLHLAAAAVRPFPRLNDWLDHIATMRALGGHPPPPAVQHGPPSGANFVAAAKPPTALPAAPVLQSAGPPAAVQAQAGKAANPPAGKAVRPMPPPAQPAPRPAEPLRSPAQLPPPNLLAADSGVYTGADVRQLQALIETTLEDFNVPVRVVHVETGPTVTQFGVEPLYIERAGQRRKVSVNRIKSLENDLALALAAAAVRIEAPVPGRPYVGIEVPNPDKTLVSLRGIMESSVMHDGGRLTLPIGRNTAGGPVVLDLARAPHMLIAGATGSGKSVCINAIVTGLLMQHGPEELRFVMVDPKRVELPGYNGIPHLYGRVITDMDQVMGALTWLMLQMDDRYRLFREHNVRNLEAYNELVRRRRHKGATPLDLLPYIVLVVDELADLMMTAAEDVERQLCRLAQMSRATGIHLVLATQRPSVDVVTGQIKANFPTRIAFAVTTQIDSRVILDQPGAERLLGRGDMLVMRSDLAKLLRVQGCYVADEEINRVVAFWKKQGAAEDAPLAVDPWAALMDREEDTDELVLDALEVLRGMESVTTSVLQRRLRVGFPKAARLMEQLEVKGIIGPDLGAGQGHPVLLKQEDDGEEELPPTPSEWGDDL